MPRHRWKRLTGLVTGAGAGVALAAAVIGAPPAAAHAPARILVFSKTAAFRHSSIPTGVQAIKEVGATAGLVVDATEDAAVFTWPNLRRYRAVVFLSTTGDVLDARQQKAFESYIGHGGGYAGVHAASDTEYDWPWYGGLVGAYFKNHPAIQPATIDVTDRAHGSTAHLPARWQRTDEWYNFRADPRDHVHVLAELDESTYSGGDMGDHPTAWCQEYGGGRAWYTGGGHTEGSYAEPAFRAHLLGGIRYAAGLIQADCRPEHGYTPLFGGAGTDGWKQAGPGGFTLADGTLASHDGLGMLWYSAKEFQAYSLKLDWRLAGDDNSGVFVGFPASDDPWSAVGNGYEVQIDATDSPDRTTGSVYGFQGPETTARDRALNPPGEWNTYELVVRGERLRVYLNGVKVNDFTNTDPGRSLRQGHVGIQNHGTGDEVSFRNIRIKELAP